MIDQNQAVTLPDVVMLGTALTFLVGLWLRFEARITSTVDPAKKLAAEAMAEAKHNAEALAEYKLIVAENYSKHTFIRDVEERLGKRFDAITAELHGMRQDFQDAMVATATSAKARRARSSK